MFLRHETLASNERKFVLEVAIKETQNTGSVRVRALNTHERNSGKTRYVYHAECYGVYDVSYNSVSMIAENNQ